MASRTTWLAPPGPIADGLKIGLLGGSFNPAHEGHLHVSEVALRRLGLDFVWWLVSPQNPLKEAAGMAPLPARLSHAAARFGHHPRVRVLDVEEALGTRYTVDTVTKLQRRFPRLRFVWLMGSDNLAGFHRWRRWQRIAARIPIAVVMRPGSVLAQASARAAHYLADARLTDEKHFACAEPPAFIVLDGKRNAMSATRIRESGGFMFGA